MKKILLVFLVTVAMAIGCKNDPTPTQPSQSTPTAPVIPKKKVKVPAFDANQAHKYIERQLAFGPRVPGTPAQDKARAWFVEFFKGLGLEVIEQKFEGVSPEGVKYQGVNIIASYKPEQSQRILLASHWDSRYISDHDDKVKDKPVMGADDGASGVGILMSIAETLKANPADIGVDFVLFDVEDQGNSGGDEDGLTSSWCQGSQYWAANLHTPNYRPRFGILLDMVGGKNAQFMIDEISQGYAGEYAQKVWTLARNMGYSQYFLEGQSPGLIDDHLFVNRIAKIPMIDIINRPINGGQFEFAGHWHTQHDDILVIDKSTLHAVGQTLTAVVYQASGGNF